MPAREKDRERCDPARDPSPVPLKGASRAHRQRRPEVALAIEALLQDLGHSVVGTAETGRDALATAAAVRPDLAIMDLRLQDRIGGAEVPGRRASAAACARYCSRGTSGARRSAVCKRRSRSTS